jgi:hypothetical protein
LPPLAASRPREIAAARDRLRRAVPDGLAPRVAVVPRGDAGVPGAAVAGSRLEPAAAAGAGQRAGIGVPPPIAAHAAAGEALAGVARPAGIVEMAPGAAAAGPAAPGAPAAGQAPGWPVEAAGPGAVPPAVPGAAAAREAGLRLDDDATALREAAYRHGVDVAWP